ncbi:RND transporter [Photobacterium kishitanii]|uniref:efflux RND transporter permease subunit n=1 Tax=Photobacterium kishitanii TaxID=318456 RepID=UPI000D1720D1|nr:MMPL family transporter [Photobacterium kishitanii]PSW63258.1 RND transporter [Photobacterium kishitanii]
MTWVKSIKDGSLFVKYKWTTLILTILFAFGVGIGGQYVYFDSSYKTFFSKDNVQRVEFEHIQNEYTKSDNVLIVLTAPDGNIYNQTFLDAVSQLTKKAWELPYATRVDSLSNFQHIKAEGDDLIVTDLVGNNRVLNDADLNEIKSVSLSDPLLVNRLVKENSAATGVYVTLTLPEENPYESSIVGQAAYELRTELQKSYPEIKVSITGSTMLSHAFATSAQEDGQTIVPLMYLIILIITFATLRSISATFISLLVIVMSTSATLGVAGFMGFYFTSISSIVPTIILTLAVTDSVHILKTMLTLMKKGMKREEAIVESIKLNQMAVFLTSFTTVVGFLGLNASAVPNYHDLGNMTAIGVIFAYLFSIITLPALAAIMPIKVKQSKQRTRFEPESASSALVNFVNKRFKAIVFIAANVLIGAMLIIPTMESYDEAVKYFSQKIEFRKDTDYTIQNLTGIETIEISLQSKSGSVSDPNYLKELDLLKQKLLSEQDVVHVSTLTDTIKKLNRSMHGDNDQFLTIPESRELASQYLLLYELSLPKGLDINNTVNLDKSSSKVIVTFGDTNSARVIEVSNIVRNWIDNQMSTVSKASIGSPSLMFAHISRTNIDSMVKGTALTFLLITLSIMVAMRSFKFGLLSTISNILPSLAAFGVWALVIGKADIAVSVAATVTIGIIVDFSVHFLTKFHKLSQSLPVQEAMQKTYEVVLGPILSTSLILSCGFIVLALSEFRLNWVLGALSALMIIFAALSVFFVLPATILFFDKRKEIVTKPGAISSN